VLLLLAFGMESAHTAGHAGFHGGIATDKNEGFIRFLKVVRSFNGHDGTLERNGVINRVEELHGSIF
jgi:hypothetical protein